MLDGQRYFSEFPDEEPTQPKRLRLSNDLRLTLAAIEREISAFIADAAGGKSNVAGAAASGDQTKD